MSAEVKSADDRAKKAMADAARLAEELRSEQSHAQQVEKMRKVLESQMREMSVRLDEAESQALKGGKKAIAKLENRVNIYEYYCAYVFLYSLRMPQDKRNTYRIGVLSSFRDLEGYVFLFASMS